MKRKTIFFAVALMLISSFSFAGGDKDGDSFSGTIKYKITAEGREVSSQEQVSLPTESTLYYKDNMLRMDQVMPMMTMSSIINMDTEETILLFDQMGQKMHMTISSEEAKKAKEKMDANDTIASEYILLEGTKTIAGYTCKKAKLVHGEEEIIVYYTEDIKVEQKEFKNAPGLIMSYTTEIPDDELYLEIQVTEVSTKKLKKNVFTIPNEYEEMPDAIKDQVRASMGL